VEHRSFASRQPDPGLGESRVGNIIGADVLRAENFRSRSKDDLSKVAVVNRPTSRSGGMEIVFFLAQPHEARGVTSSEDLPGDGSVESLPVDGLSVLMDLGQALGLGDGPVARQLRDATCQSFPVWTLIESFCQRLESLDDEQIDSHAEAWQADEKSDLYERTTCLMELRDALRVRQAGESLFALLEERAF